MYPLQYGLYNTILVTMPVKALKRRLPRTIPSPCCGTCR